MRTDDPSSRRAPATISSLGSCAVLILAGCATIYGPAVAADNDRPATATAAAASSADIDAVRAASKAYRAALAQGDAAAIRQAWTADGDIVDGWGNMLSAADAAAASGERESGAAPEFQVGETTLRMITPDVVVEDGSVDVILPGRAIPLEGWFSAIWVRDGGAWKLACVRESEQPAAPTGDMLEDLDWMVGEWTLVPEGDGKAAGASAMEMKVRWDAGRAFLIREARLTSPDDADGPSGNGQAAVDLQQRIGWDPLVGRIRSWGFTTDGSRAEATWFRDGDSWVVRGTAVLPDGTQTSTVNIYTYDGKDRCVWRTMSEPTASNENLPTRATWVRKPQDGGKGGAK
jgi:hypothetical protein